MTSTGAVASSNGKWLAVLSHTTAEIESPGIPGFSGGGRGEGEMFVDVYDASTGGKVLSGRASHRGGQYPDASFDKTIWVKDQYLIVPLSAGEDFFVGILPDK